MRIVVTGGTGFLGRYVTQALAEAGHEVCTLSRSLAGPAGAAHHLCADILSEEAAAFASQGEAVIHLAGLSDASASFARPLLYSRVNTQGTLNMLEAARKAGAIFLLASSQRVYRPQRVPLKEDDPKLPPDPYGYSKLAAEHWVEMYHRLYGLRTRVVRLFSVYGPGQVITEGQSGVISIFIQKALRDEEMAVLSRSQRDFTYATDAAQGILCALGDAVPWGLPCNIATGRATSIKELAWLVRGVTLSSSPIREELVTPEESYVADISRARLLGYSPKVSLLEGIARYAQWLSENTAQGQAHAKATGR